MQLTYGQIDDQNYVVIISFTYSDKSSTGQ